MTCYHPIPAYRTPDGVVFNQLSRHDIIGDVKLPCGQCLGCRLRRARDWSFRVMHEASLYDETCFVTLTYGRDKLPPGGSLFYKDYQDFMKRLRKMAGSARIRFFMCGEYGPLNLRPHYHACLFNVSFRSDRIPLGKSDAGAVFYDSPTLRKVWGHGHVSVQDLTRQAAAYCARYIVDKVTGPAAKAHYGDLTPEFSRCSLKPGIGARWFDKFGSDVYPMDGVVFEGEKYSPPKYYDKLMKRRDGASLLPDRIEYERHVRALSAAADNVPERLAVRELVHKARVVNLKRSSLDA